MSSKNSPTEETPVFSNGNALTKVQPVAGMYEDWFLEYASYVILDRAVPYVEDGLKPVQRRILHALREMEDGRFHKVANVIGQTMQYHPHGDASIGDAMVNLGQKNLLIDTQGNWGNPETGDSAAAPRYIEARLSKFALEVAFNPKTTLWQLSYDGRKQEPVALPMKFPLLLAQGAEGIAVGLSTKILPHNFIELIEASIAYLRGKPFELYPDFITGGLVDVANYNGGERGGRLRVRAKVKEQDKKTLVITEIPYGTTTTTLIESIVKANEKGKIKIRHIDDNTAKNVEIVLHLAAGISTDITMDALFAFTDCEVSISPNCCIILQERPLFTRVENVLGLATDSTVALLKRELQIRLAELEEGWHFSSLEKIFIENRIYRDIEEAETWEAVLHNIDMGLVPYKPLLRRQVTDEDILKLTEIRIKRISRYDAFKAEEQIRGLEAEMETVRYDLDNLTTYAIDYYKGLLKKYGKGRERRTQLATFDTIQAATVAIANEKLYVNRAEGFIGTSLKKDEFVMDCSELDDILVFRQDGILLVSRVSEKTFVGKNILHVEIFRKNDLRRVFHLIYQDGKTGPAMAKRFQVQGITRDKPYELTRGTAGTLVHYFSANPNGEAEVVTVSLKPAPRLRHTSFEYNFADLAIKGRQAAGNIITRQQIKKVVLKRKGGSTLGGVPLWYDAARKRLMTDGEGPALGNFTEEDRLVALYADGSLELLTPAPSHHFMEVDLLEITPYDPKLVLSALYKDGATQATYAKRTLLQGLPTGRKQLFITESVGSSLLYATLKALPVIRLAGAKGAISTELDFATVELKGFKALGRKLDTGPTTKVDLISFSEREHPTSTPLSTEVVEPAEQAPVNSGAAEGEEQVSGTLF